MHGKLTRTIMLMISHTHTETHTCTHAPTHTNERYEAVYSTQCESLSGYRRQELVMVPLMPTGTTVHLGIGTQQGNRLWVFAGFQTGQERLFDYSWSWASSGSWGSGSLLGRVKDARRKTSWQDSSSTWLGSNTCAGGSAVENRQLLLKLESAVSEGCLELVLMIFLQTRFCCPSAL